MNPFPGGTMRGRVAVFGGLLAVMAIGVGSMSATPMAEAGQARSSVQDLGWLAGCWSRGSGALVMEEQWMRPRGGAMLGMSRTVRRDTMVEYEHLRIIERGGKAVYVAMPSGQVTTEFEAATTTDSLVTFENPAHDFPQRIIYRRRGADSLIARIEGMRAGQLRTVDFPFARVAC